MIHSLFVIQYSQYTQQRASRYNLSQLQIILSNPESGTFIRINSRLAKYPHSESILVHLRTFKLKVYSLLSFTEYRCMHLFINFWSTTTFQAAGSICLSHLRGFQIPIFQHSSCECAPLQRAVDRAQHNHHVTLCSKPALYKLNYRPVC